jgi:transcriptional regulator with XRE-family HTH domain
VGILQRLSFNLKRLRRQRGWSQERLGFEADVHRTYVSDLERVARNPTLEMLEKLAKALGVPATELIREPDPGDRTIRTIKRHD